MKHARTNHDRFRGGRSLAALATLLAGTLAGSAVAGGTACIGDTNDDGFVDIDDLVNVVLDFGTPGFLHGGDVNGDGIADIDDIVLVVLQFGPCPQPSCPPLILLATNPEQPTVFDFNSLDVPPIPPDFFGPGSLPFEGPIEFKGMELDPGLPLVDTTIMRLDPIDFVDLPLGVAEVPIQIIELHLVGVQPIQVQTDIGGQEWCVGMGLSENQQPGQLSATKSAPDGGTFQAEFFVRPIFAFAREDDLAQLAGGFIPPEQVELRLLDFGIEGLPPLDLGWNQPMPWSTQPPQDGGFFCPTETFFPGFDPVPPAGEGGAAGVAPGIPCLTSFGGGATLCSIAPPPGRCTYDLIGLSACIDVATGLPTAAPSPRLPPATRVFLPCTPGPCGGCPPFVIIPVACDAPGAVCVAYYECVGCGP